MARARKLFLIAAEESGDRLGAALMRALRARSGDNLVFEGLGGRAMAEEGLAPLFPIDALSIIGFAAVVAKLPMIFRRIRETAEAVLRADPDALIIIDSPDFTHRVARAVRRRTPAIPILNYAPPTVWAWRPGRARAMRAYVDHALALLPFEPDEYRTLNGPPCTYVGHPLIEQRGALRPDAAEAARRVAAPPLLAVLPGSRRGEIARHAPIFGETLAKLSPLAGPLDLVLPTTPHLVDTVNAAVAGWPVRPRVVVGDEARRAAFRSARGALAKSGTVTLELALAGVPMIAAYKVAAIEAMVARRVIRTSTVILANLILGDNVVPEFLQEDCTAERLAPALAAMLGETPLRARQLAAFARLDAVMATGASSPSERAAEVVLAHLRPRPA